MSSLDACRNRLSHLQQSRRATISARSSLLAAISDDAKVHYRAPIVVQGQAPDARRLGNRVSGRWFEKSSARGSRLGRISQGGSLPKRGSSRGGQCERARKGRAPFWGWTAGSNLSPSFADTSPLRVEKR